MTNNLLKTLLKLASTIDVWYDQQTPPYCRYNIGTSNIIFSLSVSLRLLSCYYLFRDTPVSQPQSCVKPATLRRALFD